MATGCSQFIGAYGQFYLAYNISSEATTLRPLEIVLDIETRTYDIDFAGVVSNIVYVRWLEDLRLEMLRCFLPLPDLVRQDLAPAIISTTINYKYPTRLFDRVRGAMWLTNLGRTRWEVTAQFTHKIGGMVLAEAVQTGLLLNVTTGRPSPVPNSLRTLYEGSLQGCGVAKRQS